MTPILQQATSPRKHDLYLTRGTTRSVRPPDEEWPDEAYVCPPDEGFDVLLSDRYDREVAVFFTAE